MSRISFIYFYMFKACKEGGLMDTLYFQGHLYSDFAEYLFLQIDFKFQTVLALRCIEQFYLFL